MGYLFCIILCVHMSLTHDSYLRETPVCQEPRASKDQPDHLYVNSCWTYVYVNEC